MVTPEPLTIDDVTLGAGPGPVLIVAGGDWVAPVRLLQDVFDELTAAGTRIVHLDVVKDPASAHRLRVVSLPTFVVWADGREQRRLVGAVGRQDLAALAGVALRGADRRPRRRR